jgi:SAM-dependent methyltransferase
MITESIQRQYNEVVASHYDIDPQAVTGRSLERALDQLRAQHLLDNTTTPLHVLDVGMGTGLFLARLMGLRKGIQPFGIDLAEQMVAHARRRIPGLAAEVGDAVNVDACFAGRSFDLVCTHFVTGFVPLRLLAPKLRERLVDGGYWSFVGGTSAGFPKLQAKADGRVARCLVRAGARRLQDVLLNPADQDEVVRTLEAHHFQVVAAETFEPTVEFPTFDAFMEFGYRGGWFTPLIEGLGLHKANKVTRQLLNRFYFPITDHHNIAVVLARKGQP